MLHRAVDAGRPDAVRLVVELGVDVNGMVPGTGLDRAALHNAAGWRGVEMVKLLLDLGADPHLRDLTYHAAPIGWALHNDQREVVDFLLPFASIFDAVQCGGIERVSALLEENPSLANTVDDGGNPIAFYVHPGIAQLKEMVELLAAHGMDVHAANKGGKSALDRAFARGWTDVTNVLREAGARPAP
jgi:ankyrin repeat protein